MLNAWGFVAIVLCIAAGLVWTDRVLPPLWRAVARYLQLRERMQDMAETRMARASDHQARMDCLQRDRFDAERVDVETAQRKTAAPDALVIPEDLEAVIMEESADWLREEMRQQYRKLYVEYGRWNAVRRAVGIGAMDEETV